MSKKYLRKNEFRFDLNKSHLNKKGMPHPAYITAKHGHSFKANIITHSRTINGVKNFDIDENPNKLSNDNRQTRFGVPFWQNETQFSSQKLKNFRFTRRNQKYIRKVNKKFK